MSSLHTVKFSPKSESVRGVVTSHRQWIGTVLGVPLSSTVAISTDLPITQIGVRMVLGYRNEHDPEFHLVSKLLAHVHSVEIPPYEQAFVSAETERDHEWADQSHTLPGGQESHVLQWGGCPLSIRLRGAGTAMVALRAAYMPSPQSHGEESEHVIIVARHAMPEIIALLDQLGERDEHPKLRTFLGAAREVAPCRWDDLVLDDNVLSLLRGDFTTFFQRRDWFHRNRLPHRRGYLLHGKPGNGKSSAIRAMLHSQKLDAYTLRLFDYRTDDESLERVFDTACRCNPAMIVLEDLDRAFPRAGENRCRVSLQALLNCLDGVSTSEGMVVVATANQPTLLDPAILKRPGRFDRVVLFPDPTAELRGRYFQLLNGNFTAADVEDAVVLSGGCSFAQLREAYIIGAQHSFERGDEITATDLVEGVLSLRRCTRLAARPADNVGFGEQS
jgi:hypothetical protein